MFSSIPVIHIKVGDLGISETNFTFRMMSQNREKIRKYRICGQPDIQPDNLALFISRIRPDTEFDLPDIQHIPYRIGTENSWISGQIKYLIISIYKISKNVFLVNFFSKYILKI
jgi:hypothetical protein